MMPGMPERRTHDYVRHGTTTLFAAMNVADGTVITSLHRRHRAIEFKKFLTKIDHQVPDEFEIHLICDNYGTHKHPIIKTWLETHPRVKLHFTPTYSSWLNPVERFFGYVTADLLQRSDHRSVQALEADIRKWSGLEQRPQALRLDQDRRTDRFLSPGLVEITPRSSARLVFESLVRTLDQLLEPGEQLAADEGVAVGGLGVVADHEPFVFADLDLLDPKVPRNILVAAGPAQRRAHLRVGP